MARAGRVVRDHSVKQFDFPQYSLGMRCVSLGAGSWQIGHQIAADRRLDVCVRAENDGEAPPQGP